MFNSLFSFLTFLLFSHFRLVRSNTWVPCKLLTHERSIDLCLQTFPKLLLLLVPKVTTRSLYPECIANLKLPIDAFYRKSRSGVNIAKRIITTGLFGLGRIQDFKLGGRILKNCAERRKTGQVILPTISSMYTISNYLASCFLWIDLSTDSVQAKENKAKSHKPNNKIGTH
jgi:hypothetical protein